MTALATRMRTKLDSRPVNRISRYAGVKPDRNGSDDEIEQWFAVQIGACLGHIRGIVTDKLFRDDETDRSHVMMIRAEIDELESEREWWRLYYKGQNN